MYLTVNSSVLEQLGGADESLSLFLSVGPNDIFFCRQNWHHIFSSVW